MTRPAVVIRVDGADLRAEPGETVLAALLRHGLRRTHRSRRGAPRGMLCGIGTCQDCWAEIDGVRRRTCLTPVRPGLEVVTG